MKKIKIIAAILSFSVLTGIISGCARGGSVDNGEITPITIWHSGAHSKKYFEDKVAEYNQTIGKEKGIEIKFEVKPDLSKQIELALANDAAPDIFMALSAANVQKAAEAGQIAAINNLPDGQELVNSYKDYIVPNGFDDNTYTIPHVVTTRALIYNKDMFKAAGLVDESGEPTPPETFAEVAEYAKKLTNPAENKYGIVLPIKWGNWQFFDWCALITGSNGTIKGYNPVDGTYDYSGLKPIAEMYLQIKKDGSAFPGADSMDNDMARARFAEGLVGMKISASYDVGVLTDQFPAKCDWGVAPLPTADKDNRYKQDAMIDNFAYINQKSVDEKGAEKILEVYKWFISDEIVKETYKKGYFIPVKSEVIVDIKPEDVEAPKQWAEYAANLDITVNRVIEMPRDYGEDFKFNDVIRDYLWTEKWTVDKAIEYMTTTANEATKRYKANHPDMDESINIQKDWDTLRKD